MDREVRGGSGRRWVWILSKYIAHDSQRINKMKEKIEKNEIIIAERKRCIHHSLSSVIIIAVKKSK